MEIDKFLEVENKYGLLEKEIDGFSYWVYSRFFIYDYLKNSGTGTLSPKESSKVLFLKGFGLLKNMVLHCHYKHQHTDLLVFNHERRVKINDVYECIYTDEILKKYSSYQVFERTFQKKHFRPVNTQNLVYIDGLEVFAELSYIINRALNTGICSGVKKKIREQIAPAFEELELGEQRESACEKAVEIIMRNFFLYKKKRKYFEKVLKETTPKVILEVVSYNMDCMIMNELTVDSGVCTIELQHGVIGMDHVSYNYPENSKIKQFPKKILTFSKYWAESSRMPIAMKDRVAVGYPYFEKNINSNPYRSGKKDVILVLSQPIVQEKFGLLVETLAKRMPEKTIIYKLHPIEYATWKEQYGQMLDGDNIKVIDNNEKSLYYYFSRTDYIVGYTTTALFESLPYKIPLFLFNDLGMEHVRFKVLLEHNCAKLFSKTDELVSMIKNCDDHQIKDEDTAYFWEFNALYNISKVIDSCM